MSAGYVPPEEHIAILKRVEEVLFEIGEDELSDQVEAVRVALEKARS